MSTKTSIKRIALVAVSALGFGLLSVVPAKAAEGDAAEVTAIAVANATGRLGNAVTAEVGFTSSSLDTGDEVTIRARFDSRPAGSTATVAFNNSGLALAGASNDTATYTAANGSGNVLLPAKLVVDGDTGAYTDGAHVAGRVGFVADVAGTYSMTIWHDADGDGLVDTGEAVDTATFTIATGPTSISVTRINSITAEDGAVGALVKLTLLNAGGTAAALADNESISLDPSGTGDIAEVNGSNVTSTAGDAYSLTAANFIGGVAWVNIINAEVETVTVSMQGVGGDVASLTGTFSVQFVDTDTTLAASVTTGATGNKAHGANWVSNNVTDATGQDYIVPLGSSSITYTVTATTSAADSYAEAKVTDTSGRSTGSVAQAVTGLEYDLVGKLDADQKTTFTVAMTSTAVSQSFVWTLNDGTDIESEVAADIIDLDGGSVTVSPSASITATPAGSLTYSVLVKDQFGRALTTGTVTMTISGRNATTASTQVTKSLDSTGRASFTVTDAPAAGVTATADTVTFTAADANGQDLAATASITWSAQTVGTVVLTGGNTTAGVTATTPVDKDIAAGTSGAQATTHSFSATVKDANGNLLAGTPVTWTISGTGAAVLSTSATSYTNASGVASASVYGWIAGTYTVTATAGGKSGTGTITFAQATATEARTLSATVSGSIVTAKVVDRFGNPVSGVAVYATKTGAGYFGSGVTRTNSNTGVDGTVEFVIAGGDAEVTLTTYDQTVAGAKGSGQTCARAGAVDCNDLAADDTAFTATTVGTIAVAETGVGASFAPAGVSLVKASVSGVNAAAEAAADAAAEAIDAANAATDAANLAAEAADAATVAAEEARDAADAATAAVEELATQVATLMAALKAQITTLANTVAKIAKKVRA